MNILCFASAATMLEKVSTSLINLNAHGVSIELRKSLEPVYRRLCQSKITDCIAVLRLKNNKEIHEIMAMQEILIRLSFFFMTALTSAWSVCLTGQTAPMLS